MFRKMSFKQSSNNTSQSDLPIAESTHIEDSTPSKSSTLAWSNRFGLKNNTVSPILNQSATRNAINKANVSKLDPTVFLDTQSNGFSSRVVKYYDTSETKTRSISNQSYRRPGDFPIVNLERKESCLSQRKENVPKISKLNIAPPINLISQASARSTIFRTGKNYGETIGPIGKSNSTNTNSAIATIKPVEPLPSTSAHDEPIVPSEADYNAASARSSLDALKEISRKRIRCDELDGEHEKRKKPETSTFDSTDGAPFSVAVKRTRDRISPTNSSPAPEAQKKRYKNNDILSSLSSSALINSTKRVLDYDLAPAKRHEPDTEPEKSPVNDIIPVSARPSINDGLTRIGASNSDLPHHKPAQFPKIVSKSMSDSAVGVEQQTTPQKQASKLPKITLFNKDYGSSTSTESVDEVKEKEVSEEDEDNSISYVKPKASSSTRFCLNKNKDPSKNKLAMMLSFLRGDETKDEVDSVSASNKIANNEKKVEDKNSISANLSTSTVVTFSTATTTSVLNSTTVPSSINSTKPLESSVKVTETSKEDSKNETVSKPLISFSPMPVTKPVLSVAQTNNESSKNEQAKQEEQTVTTAASIIPKNVTSPNKTIVSSSTTTTDNTPRLGGFAFSAAQINTVSTSGTTQSVSSTTNTSSATTFSFETSKPTLGTGISAKPTFSFGSTKVDEQPKSAPVLSSSGLTLSVPAANSTNTFSLGSSIPKPAQSESNKISFALPTTNSTSTVQSTSVTSASAGFSFGSPKNTTNSSNTLSTNTGSAVFAFGSNASSTQAAPPFGSVKSPNTTLPSFGNVANTNTNTNTSNTTPKFGSPTLTFGNNPVVTTTSSVPVFGAVLTQSTPAFGATVTTTSNSGFAFGNNNSASTTTNSAGNLFQFGNSAKPNVTTQSNTFGATSNISTTNASTNLFGTTGSSMTANALSKPAFAFGNKTENNAATTTSIGTSSIFGSPVVTTAPPSFESSLTNSRFGSGFSSTFGQANKTAQPFGNNPTNTVTTTASTNMFGASSPPAFGSTNNIFGSTNNAQAPPAFGSTNSASTFGVANNNAQNTAGFSFSSPATTQANQSVFAFGQNQSTAQPSAAVTTASIFGSNQTNTNTNSFVFGQSNIQASSPAGGIFGPKPVENNSMTAPPAFGSSTNASNSVFNFTPKPNMFGNSNTENKPAPFSFNAPNNNNAATVTGFGSAPAFGSTANSNANQPFAFGGQSVPDASKPAFNFNSGSTSAPLQPNASAPFSFNAPSANNNAFQFNAGPQQPAPTNIFSIGPSTPTTTKTGRPMRTATRRIK